MLGTWEIAKMKKSSLPEKVASGFSEATKNLNTARFCTAASRSWQARTT